MTKRVVVLFYCLLFSEFALSGKGLVCVDYRGLQVAEVPSNMIGDIAMASNAANGQPIILFNPIFTNSVSRQTEAFFFAHECAHHALAHTIRNIPFSREQEADCWAIAALYNNGIFSDHDVNVVQQELSILGKGDWTHLPGPMRAINLKGCLNSSNDSEYGDVEEVDTYALWEKCFDKCTNKSSRCYDRCESDSCYERCDSTEERCTKRCDRKHE